MEEKYNSHIQDFISKLPGVHSKNLYTLLNKGQSLDHLIKLSQVSEQELWNQNSFIIYNFFFCKL